MLTSLRQKRLNAIVAQVRIDRDRIGRQWALLAEKRGCICLGCRADIVPLPIRDNQKPGLAGCRDNHFVGAQPIRTVRFKVSQLRLYRDRIRTDGLDNVTTELAQGPFGHFQAAPPCFFSRLKYRSRKQIESRVNAYHQNAVFFMYRRSEAVGKRCHVDRSCSYRIVPSITVATIAACKGRPTYGVLAANDTC